MATISYVRTYGFFAYWLVWAVFTLRQAQYPGLMLHPEQWSYPWVAVFSVWLLLAVLIGILQLILRPGSYHRSWGRLLIALAYSGILVALGLASVGTDAPGYYYVPAQFALLNMGVMLLFAVVQTAVVLWHWGRHAA